MDGRTPTQEDASQANSLAERRIGLLHQMFRVLLLTATAGHMYYEALWGRGLHWSNELYNYGKWPDRPSPVSYLAGIDVPMPTDIHVFGA